MACQVGRKIVEGFMYETSVLSEGGGGYDQWTIHIPSRNLSLQQKGGRVFFSTAPVASKKAMEILFQVDLPDRDALVKKAEEEARTLVHIPQDTIDQICSLAKDESILQKNPVDKRISLPVKEIFKQLGK